MEGHAHLEFYTGKANGWKGATHRAQAKDDEVNGGCGCQHNKQGPQVAVCCSEGVFHLCTVTQRILEIRCHTATYAIIPFRHCIDERQPLLSATCVAVVEHRAVLDDTSTNESTEPWLFTTKSQGENKKERTFQR